MTTTSLTRTDAHTRDAVRQELAWDSQVVDDAVGVAARNGAVTLTGFIDSYAGKLAAERAAKRVRGVRAVANDIQVTLKLERTDADIASDAARALNLRVTLPEGVKAAVHGGHVTLTGSVSSLFQRAVAEKAIHDIKGVKEIVNRIEVTDAASTRDVQREIGRALHRNADLNARSITAVVVGHKVRLNGMVGSWHEREAAELAASHATGITSVDNQIGVRMDDVLADDRDEIC